MSEHHPTLAPSSWPGLDKCACFRPDKSETKYSRHGNDEHAILANLLRGLPVEWSTVDQTERENIEWAFEYIKLNSHSKIHVEERGRLLDDNFEQITFGRIDAWSFACLNDQSAVDLFDYKSGQMRDYRAQLIAYALILLEKLGCQRCRVHCVYGRFRRVQKFEITRQDAWDWVNRFLAQVRDPSKSPVACDYCAFCADRLTCPARIQQVNAIAKGRPDWALENYHSSQITDPKEMSKALKLARRIKDWCEAVEYHARKMALEKGMSLPGFKVQNRAGRREVHNLSLAYQRCGLPQDVFLKCCDLRFGELEEAFATTHGMKVAAAKRELSTRLGDLVERRPDTKSIIEITDKTNHADN